MNIEPEYWMKRQRKRRHVSQPWDTQKIAGERLQIDVKYVPSRYLVTVPYSKDVAICIDNSKNALDV